MANKFKAYFIECLTNMHVGSGDASYGVVDKLVQRDPVTSFPTIHASSLKGALREHFERKNQGDWKKGGDHVVQVFGKEVDSDGESESGDYRFLGADLVALPVRCNFQQFVMGVNQNHLKNLNEKARLLSGAEVFNPVDVKTKLYYKEDQPAYNVFAEDVFIEDKSEYSRLLRIPANGMQSFKSHYASLSDDDFMSVTKDLPVIARNKLENGISKNLWYEEVVPHKTVFFTFFTASRITPEFEENLKKDVIQIGGNASVGYGLCKFHEVNL